MVRGKPDGGGVRRRARGRRPAPLELNRMSGAVCRRSGRSLDAWRASLPTARERGALSWDRCDGVSPRRKAQPSRRASARWARVPTGCGSRARPMRVRSGGNGFFEPLGRRTSSAGHGSDSLPVREDYTGTTTDTKAGTPQTTPPLKKRLANLGIPRYSSSPRLWIMRFLEKTDNSLSHCSD
jgi:hypothetical protein